MHGRGEGRVGREGKTGRWGGRPEVIANTAKREGIGKHGNLGIRGVTDYARNTYYSEPNAGIGA